jgi:membrane fusion protein, multidrug efflux system
MKMNKLLLILPIIVLVTACNQDPAEALKNEKANIEKQQLELAKRLHEINQELTKLLGETISQYPDVTANVVEQKFFEHQISLQGLIEADKMTYILPEAGGLITSLPAKEKEGKLVQKGEILATIDAQILTASMKELEEQIELAKYMFEKQESLFKQGVGTELQYKQAEGQYQALLQSKNTLTTQKGKYTVTAPFTGYIEKVHVVQGGMVGPTSPILTLVSPGERKVVAQVAETYLSNLEEGAPVTVQLPALNYEEIPNLKVTRVGKMVDPVNRTIALEIRIPHPTEKHIPNLMATINVRDYADSAALVIPSKVILKDAQQKSYVYTLSKVDSLSNENNAIYKAEKTLITIGKSYQNETQVLNGLLPGNLVVNRGKGDIYEGMFVRVVTE